MPRGRAQVSILCNTLPDRSRIVSELLFSLETKTLPVAFADSGSHYITAKPRLASQHSMRRLRQPGSAAKFRRGQRHRALLGPAFGRRWYAAHIARLLL